MMASRNSAGPATAVGDAAFELAHAGTLQCFAELVRELGGDPQALMQSAGIEPAALAGCAPRLSYRAMINLLELAATHLQRADFGMRLAKLQGGGRVFGPIGVVMRNSRTLGEALAYVANHIHAYSLAADMRIEQDRAQRRAVVAFDVLLEQVTRKSQTMEQLLLLGHYNALEITRGRARVREVRFRHRPLSPTSVYRDYFGCEVRFDESMDAIVFTQQDMDAPIVHPELDHYEMATFFIDANFPPVPAPTHARVRASIMKHVGMADCSIERVAAELCMHPRTLHRRLKWEGKSFEEIKDEVRRDTAQYYLEQTDLPFTRVAEKLGYAETSVLSRSCLRWFGCAPSEVRSRSPVHGKSSSRP